MVWSAKVSESTHGSTMVLPAGALAGIAYLGIKSPDMHWEINGIYVLVIGLELLISNFRKIPVYHWREVLTNFALSLGNAALDLAVRGGWLLVMITLHRYRLFGISTGVGYWVVLFILVDFQFYWLHRLEHFCRLFWAAHVTHHSAEHMNLTVGFRATVVRPLYDFLFFLPLAFLGFRPQDILLIYSIAQIWGVAVHTELVGKLGWMEALFVTPSHHRVHHASNPQYLDRNMGMVLIIWDRIFGTFQRELSAQEYERIRYGLASPPPDKSLPTLMLHEWRAIWRDFTRPGLTWGERLRYVFGRPGWKPVQRREDRGAFPSGRARLSDSST